MCVGGGGGGGGGGGAGRLREGTKASNTSQPYPSKSDHIAPTKICRQRSSLHFDLIFVVHPLII